MRAMPGAGRHYGLAVLAAIGLSACGQQAADSAADPAAAPGQPPPAANAPLIVYAPHDAANTAGILDAYKVETGVRFQLITDEYADQDARLKNPDFFPKADLFFSGSLAEAWAVAEADKFRPVVSATINKNIPEALRDAESRWIGLAKRARVVIYNTGEVSADEIGAVRNYASLRDEAWRGRLCLSSSKVSGNRSLVAFLILRYDVREAEIIVRQWRANLAEPIYPDDTALVSAVAAGNCAIAIVDSDVLAVFAATYPDASLAPRWFDAAGATLIDVSGAGVTRHAANPAAALQLLEWLTAAAPNALYAIGNMELPANPNAPLGAAVSSWARHVAEPESLTTLGFLQEEAMRLIERARYP